MEPKAWPGAALKDKVLAAKALLNKPELDLRIELVFLENDVAVGMPMAEARPAYEELIKKAGPPSWERTLLLVIQSYTGFLYTNGELKRALELCHQGLDLIPRIVKPSIPEIMNMRALLAMIFRELGDNRKSDEIFEAVLLELRELPYRNLYMETLYNYANRTEDLPKSVSSLQEVIRMTHINHYTFLEAIALRSLGSSYTAMNQIDKALEALNQAVILIQKEEMSKAYLITALRSRADVLNRLKQWQAAAADCEKAAQLTPPEDLSTLIEIEIQWVNAYKGLEDYRAASEHQQRLLQIRDQQYKKQKAEEINQLSIQMGLRLEEEKSQKLKTRVETFSIVLAVAALALILLVFALSKSRSVQQKQAQLQRITKHVHEGIINIKGARQLEAHISPHIAAILQLPVDEHFLERLWVKSALSADVVHMLDQILAASIGEAVDNWAFNVGNMPSEITLHESEHILALDWHPIPSESGQIISIVLAIRDITDRRQLELIANRAEQQTQLYANRIQQVQSTPVQLAHDLLNKINRCIERFAAGPEDKPALKRELHLIKGVARSLSWQELRDFLHQFEDRLLEGAALAPQWQRLEEIRHSYQDVFNILHGLKHQTFNSLHPQLVGVVAAQYQSLRNQLQAIGVELDSLMLIDKFCCWEKIPREILETMLVHGLSNAIDHGFVRPIQEGHARRSCAIKITSEIQGKHLHLAIEDNGFGIDFSALKRLAQERNLNAKTDEELVDLVLLDGISTARSVTQSSGRGVGLSAIAALARNYSGSVALIPNAERGVTLRLEIPIDRLVKNHDSAA